MPDRICSIGGCDKPINAYGYCGMHAQRWVRYGDPEVLKHRSPNPGSPCAVEGCESLHFCKGFCRAHYERWKKYGNPTASAPPREYPILNYAGMHNRLRNRRGKAEEHLCVNCRAQAAEWSYSNACEDERVDDTGRWCPHFECYRPLCSLCHRRFDLGKG